MRGRVAVITPTIKSRSACVGEAASSVAAQNTEAEICHFIAQDTKKAGPAYVINKVIPMAIYWGAAYAMILDDDDILYPDHIQLALDQFQKDSTLDVVSAYCDTEGRRFNGYNQTFSELSLELGSVISHTSVYRTRFWHQGLRYEEKQHDWKWWKKLLHEGASFKVIKEITWLYRLDGGNLSHGENPWEVEK